MRYLTAMAALAAAGPAAAATGPFFSLGNTDFVVLIAFLLFVGVLVYYKVPGMLGGMLDKRAAAIRSDLDEARALREEAQKVLADFERRHRDVKQQADRIVERAKQEAAASAEQARADIEASVARRLRAAEEQIASAEADAVRAVREQAIAVSIAVAGDVLSEQMTAQRANALIDASIEEIGARLN
ncbi:MAG: F0F1 ATP synthase subunit B [Rhodobacteraceae bacterium]|nr:F0F1 ATP synthase subunit B [Paracoccaceae bacterium]